MKKRVVIVGGGFAGIHAARVLGRDRELVITVIDKRNHHLFQPLLYQVALALLSPAEIAIPIRSLLRKQKNTKVILGTAESVDLEEKVLCCNFGKLPYDYLILACGSMHSYFGNEHWEPFAPGLKTLEQAEEIRRRVLSSFEQAECTDDDSLRSALLTFAVVGGGPTGVELAGALAEMSHQAMARDFRSVDPKKTRIVLIEGSDRILGAFPEKLSNKATKSLEDIGVEVKRNALVTNIDKDGVEIGDEVVLAKTVIWAAGVQPAAINKSMGVALDKGGRVCVERDLSLKNHRAVFVLGDQACFVENGTTLPGLAPVAMQQGRHAAENIRLEVAGKSRRPFKYRDKGMMATIGRSRAIASFWNFNFSGLPAWFAWLFVHILYLVGFKNRLIVLIRWAWSFFNSRRGSRLITDREWRSFPSTPPPSTPPPSTPRE
jgi:NADH:ubiquinone reductase (H+-translocating)